MNWLDVVIIVGIAAFVLSSSANGFFREVFGVVGLIGGVVLAGHYYDDLAQRLPLIDQKQASQVVAFILIIVATAFVAQLAGSFLHRLASFMFLGWADHLGGTALGLVKGLIVAELALILFVHFPDLNMQNAVRDSGLAPYFLQHAPWLLNLLPDDFEGVRHFLH